ncbi:hypothetical protein CPLU01_07775 [Colletotrichum plurivorum]|uniref:Uncharacterized protein n=1 Tax=Colletotrichum plurivorum TaxID=2175906 RepID=A0A8H6KEB3_9PEZI|nr:hypothetical protein CPLU01_07775 [Colletotrichum plurivorum]
MQLNRVKSLSSELRRLSLQAALNTDERLPETAREGSLRRLYITALYGTYGLFLGANRLGSTLSPVASPFASIKVFSGSQGSWLLPRKYVRDPSVFAHRRGYIEQISRAWVSYAANVGTDLTLEQSIERCSTSESSLTPAESLLSPGRPVTLPPHQRSRFRL